TLAPRAAARTRRCRATVRRHADSVTSATCGMRSSPNGNRAVTRATPATHATSTPVGTWTARAIAPPTTPAGTPAASPHIITGPAAGTAMTLAGSAATGSPPQPGTSTGATPTWAASVTANADATGRGPGTAATSGWANSATPAHAPAESRKPT